MGSDAFQPSRTSQRLDSWSLLWSNLYLNHTTFNSTGSAVARISIGPAHLSVAVMLLAIQEVEGSTLNRVYLRRMNLPIFKS